MWWLGTFETTNDVIILYPLEWLSKIHCAITECLCPPIPFICWSPNPQVMVLGSEAFGRGLGHEGMAFMNGNTAFRTDIPENSSPLPSCESPLETDVYEEWALFRYCICWYLHLGLLSLQNREMWKINFCCLQNTQSLVFCYSSPNRQRLNILCFSFESSENSTVLQYDYE